MFDPVDPRQNFPDLEKGILQYWKEEDIFKRSVTQRNSGEEFNFYDGPPFATGLPHYGHLLAGAVKDVIPRYQTMRGKKVQRRFGWDCHGLPIENLIEKEHKIESRKDIEEMGVEKFNDLCRSAVMRCSEDWRNVVERMGRFVDMDWDYKTMDPDYMESIWWVFSELYKKNLVQEGHKPMHICPRCATALSNFEVSLGYSDRDDMSTIATFPLVDDPKTVILAWTTTTWSLPGDLWLGFGADISYVKVQQKGDDRTYIVSEKLADTVFKDREYEIVGNIDPHTLVGKKYIPLFDYYVDTPMPSTVDSGTPETFGERAFYIILHPEVAEDEGTGIVHFANTNAEDGFLISQEEDIDLLHYFGTDGRFYPEVADFAGMEIKPQQGDPMKTDKVIIEKLKEMDRWFDSYTLKHSYPHCWRCDSPLLNYATSSWFVMVEQIKEKLLRANSETEWVPSHIRDGRFGRWLEGARDWAVSRNRYWGTPLPIWRADDNSSICVLSSRDEIAQRIPDRFTKVTVIRHGESEGNLVPVYQSKIPGTSLTTSGKEQAKKAGKWLSEGLNINEKVTVYASPLARTQETAAIVADHFDTTEVLTDDRLRETEFGDFEGKTVDFSDLAFVKERRAHKIDSSTPESIYHLPGMEEWDSVSGRVSDFLKEVLEKHKGEHIVIVSHADPCIHTEHFFTKEDPFKLSHRPYPEYATPKSFYWDHKKEQQMDLHKDTIDELTWTERTESDTSIFAIRHGQTDWNKDGMNQGHTDTELNATGKKQIEDAAKNLSGDNFDLIVCSDLLRTKQTAEILSKALNLPIEEENAAFRERCFGEYEGKPTTDLADPYTHAMDIADIDLPGGESQSEFFERIQSGLSDLRTKYIGKRILLVTHGGVMIALKHMEGEDVTEVEIENGAVYEVPAFTVMRRIPEVFDCWFESGSMPYAEVHYPFDFNSGDDMPRRFPANFISENLDQTRGWFYTLMVLSVALFDKPAFWNCICGGMILAEDGKKMSKRLKNYPDPGEVMEEHGADALRFTLMSSPVVRAEELRFSDKPVAETVRSVILPLWNSYSFFVTYANAAGYEPQETRRASTHPLDIWIRAEVQDLVNRMTEQLDRYDLSATCSELDETIDMLTNWYIRLSRRRFAGKSELEQGGTTSTDEEQIAALHTLYDVLLTLSQLLAPFCPYISEAIYLNLVSEDHGSIHLTDWPESRPLSKEEEAFLAKTRYMRTIVSLGNKVRSTSKIKNRQPLAKATVAAPPRMKELIEISDQDTRLLLQELNVKSIEFTDEPETLADVFVLVDARKVGPRLGKRVQEIINAGKEGAYTQNPDGSFTILDQTLAPDEAEIVYKGKEDMDVAAERGIVVGMETVVTEELEIEGVARDIIRSIQRLRKDAGLSIDDTVSVNLSSDEDMVQKAIEAFGDQIQNETKVTFGDSNGSPESVTVGDDLKLSISISK